MASKQPGPDFHLRLGDEKAEWREAAKADGIDRLGTWVKKVIRDHIKKQRAKAKRDQDK